ncbi:hypothetical protein L7A49_33160, partial [Achromobacter xylosoxidans]|nr:hypothetical protein [Achromobacter xylosoxidans]
HNRALSQLAAKSGKAVADIEKLVVWGNHSPTMYPDYRFATVGVQHRPHRQEPDQVRRRRLPHRRPGRRQALRPPSGQGNRQ